MALGVLPVLVVLDEIDAGWMPWAWVLFCGLAWPQLAYLHAQCSRDPFAAELRNFMVDSAMVGTLIPLMQFNLLPSVALLAVTTADKLNFGVRVKVEQTWPARGSTRGCVRPTWRDTAHGRRLPSSRAGRHRPAAVRPGRC